MSIVARAAERPVRAYGARILLVDSPSPCGSWANACRTYGAAYGLGYLLVWSRSGNAMGLQCWECFRL